MKCAWIAPNSDVRFTFIVEGNALSVEGMFSETGQAAVVEEQ
jgi:hypothetical protein